MLSIMIFSCKSVHLQMDRMMDQPTDILSYRELHTANTHLPIDLITKDNNNYWQNLLFNFYVKIKKSRNLVFWLYVRYPIFSSIVRHFLQKHENSGLVLLSQMSKVPLRTRKTSILNVGANGDHLPKVHSINIIAFAIKVLARVVRTIAQTIIFLYT